jgi:predicted cupin superfamily sugar epimerase
MPERRCWCNVIDPDGKYDCVRLGNDPENGQKFQAVVKARCWFASHVADWKSWALVGCTVAPGFEYDDFEIGKRDELIRLYPQHRELIGRLTRG